MKKKNGTNNKCDLEAGENRKRQEKLLMSHKAQQKLQLNTNNKTQQQQETRDPSSTSTTSSSSATSDEEMEFRSKREVKKIWCFILLSMTFALILAAILIVILVLPTLLDQDDKCFNSFQQTNYNLFATKTTYTSAAHHLNKSHLALIEASRGTTLRELNNELLKFENCKLKQLHYFGRHAARYPSSKDILQMNKLIEAVQSRIKPIKYNSNINENNSNTNNNTLTENPKVCLNPLAEFKSWTSSLFEQNGNLITDLGIEETRGIAERFKSIYPSMFDPNQTNIQFGVTKELRTAQTALVFKESIKQQVENQPFQFESNPSQSNSNFMVAPEFVRDKRVLQDFTNTNRAQKLEFHDTCKSLHKDVYELHHNLNLDNENRTKFISVSISKKLKLNEDEYLTKDETEAIYDMCRYETAMSASSMKLTPSIWCSLFSESQLKFFEYLNDVSKFFKVYGHPDQARSACPVTTELMKSFKNLVTTSQQQFNNNQDSIQSQQQSALFYFTHSQVIEKIFANLVELELDPGYEIKNVLNNLDSGTIPKTREWQTSLLSPFSANIAFTVYQCSSSNQQPTTSDIKIVTSVNEKPILIDGCSDLICPLDRILDDGKINKEKRCKLEEICRKNIKTT